MEIINGFFTNFADKTFAIPLWPMVLIFSICLWSLIYGRHKMGLTISYFFIFYWGYLSDYGYWIGMFGESHTGQILFVFSALGIFIMGILGMIQESHR